MAGSYSEVVDDEGALRTNEELAFETGFLFNGGDVYEAIEEMYGMIWWLAEQFANEQFGAAAEPALYVEAARDEYKKGLAVSPTKRFKEQ